MPITARRVAVTYEQMIDSELDIPKREVRKCDKGALEFIASYGNVSAELEAIPPHVLREMLQGHLQGHIEPSRLKMLKLAEEEERKGLQRLQELLGGAA